MDQRISVQMHAGSCLDNKKYAVEGETNDNHHKYKKYRLYNVWRGMGNRALTKEPWPDETHPWAVPIMEFI